MEIQRLKINSRYAFALSNQQKEGSMGKKKTRQIISLNKLMDEAGTEMIK